MDDFRRLKAVTSSLEVFFLTTKSGRLADWVFRLPREPFRLAPPRAFCAFPLRRPHRGKAAYSSHGTLRFCKEDSAIVHPIATNSNSRVDVFGENIVIDIAYRRDGVYHVAVAYFKGEAKCQRLSRGLMLLPVQRQ